MKCRLCGSNSNVTDTRHNEDGDSIYRRRKCSSCGYIFYTIEFECEDTEDFKNEWKALAKTRYSRQ
jgi:transcriptional regulator NrdR family protein